MFNRPGARDAAQPHKPGRCGSAPSSSAGGSFTACSPGNEIANGGRTRTMVPTSGVFMCAPQALPRDDGVRGDRHRLRVGNVVVVGTMSAPTRKFPLHMAGGAVAGVDPVETCQPCRASPDWPVSVQVPAFDFTPALLPPPASRESVPRLAAHCRTMPCLRWLVPCRCVKPAGWGCPDGCFQRASEAGRFARSLSFQCHWSSSQ